ncbi:hypothetical protein [Chitinimonas taiwanensis]|uniref:Uncharacterized protein n=1 Tax=Chitinimonas taiwanensis DSM 18899 TaxID=1121279 RepID=A0A1K2HS19_9NEIS|nr:hypothetical protein [Chitinimonas taiwanensis]SFZ79575.1 hypothetical protein SAMN02745887_03764 [Chitinimonas taiwanensis DSM 18899]
MDAKPYTKTLQDELDWKLLDQLSGVVSQISSFCFETKKFCVTTLFVVMTLMVKFTSDKLDDSIFVAGLLIPLCFWFLDSTGYFYQVKLRGTMEQIRSRLASRDQRPLVAADGTGIIAKDRVNIPNYRKVLDAALNHSMWLYALLVVANLAVWALFSIGKIK